MFVTLVAAAAENNVIGNKGKLPWKLPDDLKHFRMVTTGHPVIMGRKTFESIGRPLPDRLNIIITRQKDYTAQGCVVVHTLDQALTLAEQNTKTEVCVIGGGEIYREAFRFADFIELTRVHTVVEGDATFPEISPEEWEEIWSEEHAADDRHEFAFTFQRLKRKGVALGHF
jgi:dihydrofolate reductase